MRERALDERNELALSPGFGWTFLLMHAYRVDRRMRVITAAWLALLVVPAGYWAGRADFSRTISSTLVAVIEALVM